MLDIKLIRTNPELVKENIKKKFQDQKLVLVDEVIEMDKQFRETKGKCDDLRSQRNSISKAIGGMMAKGQKEEAEKEISVCFGFAGDPCRCGFSFCFRRHVLFRKSGDLRCSDCFPQCGAGKLHCCARRGDDRCLRLRRNSFSRRNSRHLDAEERR